MSALTTRGSGPVLQPSSFAELMQFATMAAKSDLMPAAYKGKPENIIIAVQMGSEVGLSPMQAIQNIAVIGGRPAIWGDAMLGLVQREPLCEDIQESIEGEGDQAVAVCLVKRRGRSPVTVRFGASDAKKAGLWGKSGPWQQYPARMLQMRARGFALRDTFPDVLRGLVSAEEARDMPAPTTAEELHTTIEGRVEPQTKAALIARADSIITNGSGPPKGQPRETANWIGDDLPADMTGRDDPPPAPSLEDRVDHAIQVFASCMTHAHRQKAEQKVRDLLFELDQVRRQDLRDKLVDTMNFTMQRITKREGETLEAALPPVAADAGK